MIHLSGFKMHNGRRIFMRRPSEQCGIVQLITDLVQNFFKGNLAKQRGIADDLILIIELHVFLFHLHHRLLIVLVIRRKVNAKNCIRRRGY